MDFVQSNLVWITLALVSGAMLVYPMFTGAAGNSVSAAQAVLLINRQNALLLDVRNADEYAASYINGARNIPLDELEKRVEELAKHRAKPVVVVCASGNRSTRAIGILRKAGFEQTFSLAGGLASWRDAGQPVNTKKPA